jgi:hypothetical protein
VNQDGSGATGQTSFTLPESRWEPPSEIDEYRIIARIGAGAMGEVYLAHDRQLDRRVAIKFVSLAGSEAHARFAIEARAIARLQHANVLAVHRVGEIEGRPFLVSEFLRGTPLDALRKPVASDILAKIAIGLARGLGAAHRRGVLHRDIKPSNALWTDDGEVKILDFGLAKLGADAADPPPSSSPPLDEQAILGETLPQPPASRPVDARGLTRSDALMGTPLFMAPELWRGERATSRSDVYSLGALLFELATGRPPHLQPSLPELGMAVMRTDAPPVQSFQPNLARPLARIIDDCLRRQPEKRFNSGAEVAAALELALGEGAAASATTPYPGLAPYGAGQSALFGGRDKESQLTVETLLNRSLVIVAGPAGCGKTSLCRAGVLPALLQGPAERGEWTLLELVPGVQPLLAFAEALARLTGGGRDQVVRRLEDDRPALLRELRGRFDQRRRLLIFVDGADDLVTISARGQAAIVADALLSLAKEAKQEIRVLLTVRDDCLGKLSALRFPVDRSIVLETLSTDAAQAAISRPAAARGVSYESVRLVNVVGHLASAKFGLPLAQIVLVELWSHRDADARVIREAALDAIGGVDAALIRYAEAQIAALPEEQGAAAWRILVELNDREGELVRRTQDEIGIEAAEESEALKALVRSRVVVARLDGAAPTYQFAHALFARCWPALRERAGGGYARSDAKRRLERAALEWDRLSRPEGALWSSRQLASVAGLPKDAIEPVATEFLSASQARVTRKIMAAVGRIIFLLALAVTMYLLGAAHYAELLRRR